MESWAKLVPELVVADLEASLRFWRDLIGFSVAYDRSEVHFAYLDLAGAQLMLEQRSTAEDQWVTGPLEAPLGRGINFQIEVPALQPILERLAGAGWPLFLEPEEAWYRAGEVELGQRQFLVMDPDGYLLRLAEDIGERPAACRPPPGAGRQPIFDRLTHADWSVSAAKRWSASARRQAGRWLVEAPKPVGDAASFLEAAFVDAACHRVLLGFDFPIGVPMAYGVQTEFRSFREMLPALGGGTWSRFSEVARLPAEIGLTRPFYPLLSTKGVSRAELVAGLGVASFDDLLRVCERRTEHRRAACSLFWTLGGNQVGKGALTGWSEVIRPALLRGAALWPFDGEMEELAHSPGVVLAETYPAEAYRMSGAGFLPGQSKRRQADRCGKAEAVKTWADRHGVIFTAQAAAGLADGFGSGENGEDQFDALLGLLGMIEVADGRQLEKTERREAADVWEGWILGR